MFAKKIFFRFFELVPWVGISNAVGLVCERWKR
jgi:hypothetical protein